MTQLLFPVIDNGLYGYINHAGETVIKPRYELAYGFSEGLARITVEGKYSYIDATGKKITEELFDEASDFKGGVARVTVQGKEAYIDLQGQFIVKPVYPGVGQLSEGLIAVKNDHQWSYVDTNGKTSIILGKEFLSAGDFSEGMAVVGRIDVVDGAAKYRYGYIDKTGNVGIPPMFDEADRFSGGLASVVLDYRPGLIDISGRYVVNPVTFHFDSIERFKEGFARVRKGGRVGFVDQTGRLIAPARFGSANDFSEGLAVVSIAGGQDETERYGYIDHKGDMVIEPRFDHAEDFSEGLARVWLEHGMGYIDKKGGVVITLESEWNTDAEKCRFAEGLAAVKSDTGGWGFIDKTGTLVIQPTFDQVEPFSNGLSIVQLNNRLGLINKNGEYLFKPQFDSIEQFVHGIAGVILHGKQCYIDQKGNFIWNPWKKKIKTTEGITRKQIEKELVLLVEPQDNVRKVKLGESPTVKLTLTNKSPDTFYRVVKPGDGSEVGWREPHIYYTAQIDRGGEWIDLPRGEANRCGMYNSQWQKDVIWLKPRETLHLNGWWLASPQIDLPPGKIQLFAHYAYRQGRGRENQGQSTGMMRDVPAFTLTSNPVQFDIE